MQRFTNLKTNIDLTVSDKDEILYKNEYVSLIKYEDWTIIKESDFVVCIIYLIEENQFILRNEYIPTFKYVDGQEYHLTVLSGCVKKGEMNERALLREIEEEAGIVIDPNFKIEFLKPLFVSKVHASKYYPAIIQLTQKDYHEVLAKGDGSKSEKMSQCVKLDIKYINSVNTSDLITDYMIEKFKNYLNIYS